MSVVALHHWKGLVQFGAGRKGRRAAGALPRRKVSTEAAANANLFVLGAPTFPIEFLSSGLEDLNEVGAKLIQANERSN